MFEAKGRTAVVSGVANLTAETLLRQGYNVALYCHSQEAADAMAAKMPAQYADRFLPMYCMVGEEAPTRALIDEVLRRFGSLDVLVTGIGMHEKACVADTTAEDFQRILDSHVRNVYSLIRLCLPTLLKGTAKATPLPPRMVRNLSSRQFMISSTRSSRATLRITAL